MYCSQGEGGSTEGAVIAVYRVATDVFTKRNRGQITATLNHGSSYFVYDTDSSYEYIQDVSGEKVNILGGDSIGNCQKKKSSYENVSNSE